MLLSITNLLTGDFIIQDPSGHSSFSVKVGPSATKSGIKISQEIFAYVEPLLIQAAAASRITYLVTDDPASLADDDFTAVRVGLVTPIVVTAYDEVVVSNLTTPGAVAITIPASLPIGTILDIVDGKGDANTNNITITATTCTINGAGTLVLNTAYASARLVKISATAWLRLPG